MKRLQAKIIGGGLAAIALAAALAGCAQRRVEQVDAGGRAYYSGSTDPTYYGEPTYYPVRTVPARAVPAYTPPGYYVVPSYYAPTPAPAPTGVYYVPAAPPTRYYDAAIPDDRYYYRSPDDGRWYVSYDSTRFQRGKDDR
ncbi:hypothetical protein D3874_14430 [Oleomonas cavernae]|uniref:Lipoprotein n=1 Tax=Oleomonas cavernae TaxID=2320859 RepID=A0A418WDM8_9PROT|nr:hypothetical protein [Oleomonas cavernae]RJF88066.1 hypothetical protein D3874_14430 [Oleomonas cavernae]